MAAFAIAPKPLIPVMGRPKVAWAIDSVRAIAFSRTVIIALREHEERFDLTRVVRSHVPDAEVVLVDRPTEGQLCTIVAARHLLDRDEDVLISTSDTFVRTSIGDAIASRTSDTKGIICVARLPGDRWSFARVDSSGRVVEVAEKQRISDLASTGVYYFSRAGDLLDTADEMIANDERVRGEFYVMPVYQKYLSRGWRVEVSHATEMWDMGTPAALSEFEQYLAASRR